MATLPLLALALAGCVAEATPEPVVDAPPAATAGEETAQFSAEPLVFDGSGPAFDPSLVAPIPPASASMAVDFQCNGDAGFSIEFGDAMLLGQGIMRGACDGVASTFRWPVTEGSTGSLRVVTAEDAEWSLVATFSDDEFVADDAVGADCAAFVPVYSAFTNADSGLSFYEAFDEAEWALRVADAQAAVTALIGGAQSSLAEPLAEFATVVGRDGIVPGEALEGTEASLEKLMTACDANHTPLYVTAEFGG